MSLRSFLAIMAMLAMPISIASGDVFGENLKPHIGKVIRKIDIVRKNVFDEEMLTNPPFYYRWANSLHIVTRETVIKRELLFQVGDALDIEKVIETERNLRRGRFIGEVDIYAYNGESDSVNLVVATTDLWTTKASSYLDLAGGNYSIGLGITEENLFGWGKMIQLSGQAGNDQDGADFIYSDSRLFGTRLGLTVGYNYYTYNKGFVIGLTRPQYSLSVPFGFKSSASVMNIRPRLFSRGVEVFRYKADQALVGFEGIYSVGRTRRIDFAAGYNYEDNRYSPDDPDSPHNSIIPEDETFSYPIVGVGGSVIHYVVERYLDGAGTPEDLTLGASIMSRTGFSNEAFGATFEGTYQSFEGRLLVKPAEGVIIGVKDKVSWWHNARNERVRHITEAAIYLRPSMTHLVVFHALTDFAWRQRPTYQVLLGGGNGLRGHSFFELSGDKLAVGNIEYRYYTPIEILTVQLGGAAFFDIGNVWRRGEAIRMSQLKSDIGIGLRFGLTKSSTSRVINLDVARSLSDRGLYFTFGATAPFNLNFANINE